MYSFEVLNTHSERYMLHHITLHFFDQVEFQKCSKYFHPCNVTTKPAFSCPPWCQKQSTGFQILWTNAATIFPRFAASNGAKSGKLKLQRILLQLQFLYIISKFKTQYIDPRRHNVEFTRHGKFLYSHTLFYIFCVNVVLLNYTNYANYDNITLTSYHFVLSMFGL